MSGGYFDEFTVAYNERLDNCDQQYRFMQPTYHRNGGLDRRIMLDQLMQLNFDSSSAPHERRMPMSTQRRKMDEGQLQDALARQTAKLHQYEKQLVQREEALDRIEANNRSRTQDLSIEIKHKQKLLDEARQTLDLKQAEFNAAKAKYKHDIGKLTKQLSSAQVCLDSKSKVTAQLQQQLDSLLERHRKKEDSLTNEDAAPTPSDECPVCCEHMDVPDAPSETVTTLCGHKMHRVCMGNWIAKQNTCPLCRTPIFV